MESSPSTILLGSRVKHACFTGTGLSNDRGIFLRMEDVVLLLRFRNTHVGCSSVIDFSSSPLAQDL